MPRVVDLQLLRQMTADAMRVYEAVQQTHLFTDDGKQVLAAADQVLRETARVYLPDDVQIVSTPELATPSAREALIAKYVEIQKAHAALTDALYRFAQAQVEAKAWNDARITFDALGKIEANYRDLAAMREKLPVLQAAHAELRAGQAVQAAKRMKDFLQTHPGDRQVSAFLEPVSTRLQKEEAERQEAERKQKEEQERKRKEEAERQEAERQEAERQQREEPERIRKEELLQRIRTMEFVRVPAGEFLMGDGKQRVQVAEFWIGKTPVTVAQFEAFVELTGYSQASAGDVEDKANHPVVRVNPSDAAAFCDWASTVLNKAIRLPTETEWEKAARGTNGREYPWGNEPPDGTRCNFKNNVGGTSPVGKYSPRGDSPYGCVDMAGNVWEWTLSAYERGLNVIRGRSCVMRGGSWFEDADWAKAAVKVDYLPHFRVGDYGFRCAC